MPSFNELSLSKDLIKFPSVTPVDAGAINFLSKKLKSLGFKCKILEFSKGKGRPIKNLYARLGKNNQISVTLVIPMWYHLVIITNGQLIPLSPQ